MEQKNFVQPVNLYLSMATLPILGALVATTALQEVVLSLGLASEEIFRGDRLPILKKPESSLHPIR